MKKRLFSLILTVLMLITMLPLSQAAQAATLPGHLIINQVYGRSDNDDGAVSHSFIELYNPTNLSVNLSGWSLQYVKDGDSWNRLNLQGVIPSRCSFLVRAYSVDNVGTGYNIPAYDMLWDRNISNNQFKVALLSTTTRLDVVDPSGVPGVVDFVGTVGSDAYQGSGPAPGISKQKAVRRINFSHTGDNSADFEMLDYRTDRMSYEQLEAVRPRSLADGSWGEDIEPGEEWPREQQVIFSVPAGLYKQTVNLELSTAYTNGIVRYTTNGSIPTASSTQYTTPIVINDRSNDMEVLARFTNIGWGNYQPPSNRIFKATTIRARAFLPNGTPLGDVLTSSYFVNPNMDTRYGGLPIVSLTTDQSNFFDNARGIYVNNNFEQRGSDWERPIHMEMFETNGARVVNQDMGVRINGNATRGIPQKSLRLYAKSKYDPLNPSVAYDIFQGKDLAWDGTPVEKYDTLILRNSGNDNRESLFRDALVQRLARDLKTDYQDARQSVVFLNGEFWGIYNIRPRRQESFFANRYKCKESLVAQLEIGYWAWVATGDNLEIVAGDQSDKNLYVEMRNFIKNNSMTIPANYQKAQEYLDIDAFIDYHIVQMYSCNKDSMGNNVGIWRYKTDGYQPDAPYGQDGRFRWYLFDTDMTFGFNDDYDPVNDHADVNYNFFIVLLGENPDKYWFNDTDSAISGGLFKNIEFRNKFINRYCDLMNTTYKPENVIAQIDGFANPIRAFMPEQINRWRVPSSTNYWESQIGIMKSFAANRPGITLNHIKNRYSFAEPQTLSVSADSARGSIKVNDLKWQSAFSGKYFPGMTQTITAQAKTGYVFSKFTVKNNATNQTTEYTTSEINVTIGTAGNTVEAIFIEDTPQIPPAPTGVTAQPDNGSATVSWNSTPWTQTYRVWVSENPGGPYIIAADNVTGLSSTVTGLSNGTAYYFVVTAVGELGESEDSAQVSVTPNIITTTTRPPTTTTTLPPLPPGWSLPPDTDIMIDYNSGNQSKGHVQLGNYLRGNNGIWTNYRNAQVDGIGYDVKPNDAGGTASINNAIGQLRLSPSINNGMGPSSSFVNYDG
ncbi:MAG: CotH kinase family protein, partial [Oscillospiraceae bacterium]|nr:CotH kinase family protein [Oscillospiraceae bacterium]